MPANSIKKTFFQPIFLSLWKTQQNFQSTGTTSPGPCSSADRWGKPEMPPLPLALAFLLYRASSTSHSLVHDSGLQDKVEGMLQAPQLWGREWSCFSCCLHKCRRFTHMRQGASHYSWCLLRVLSEYHQQSSSCYQLSPLRAIFYAFMH